MVVVPWPQRMLVQGVVWPPDKAQVRSDEAGVVESVALRDGQAVQVGDVVLQLSNPALQSALARQSARAVALEAGLFDALGGGGVQAGDKRAELTAAEAELERLAERVASLTVRSHAAGRLVLPGSVDLPGQAIARGGLIGFVFTGAPPMVRLALPEADAIELRDAAGSVSVRLAGSPRIAHAAALVRDGVGAGLQLPSAALSAHHGGRVLTDPADKTDLKPLQPVVLLDVRLDAQHADGAAPPTLTERMGERAWVRFDAGWAPLSLQLAHALRRKLLQVFNPQF